MADFALTFLYVVSDAVLAALLLRAVHALCQTNIAAPRLPSQLKNSHACSQLQWQWHHIAIKL